VLCDPDCCDNRDHAALLAVARHLYPVASEFGNQEGMRMELVIVFGPPAVGKMTVGREICKLTGFKLLHNHMTVEPILEIFPYDSPAFARLVPEFRRRIVEEAVEADLSGLVFTYVWGLGDDDEVDGLDAYVQIVGSRGGTVRFVELFAEQSARLEREGSPLRLDHKRSKRDLESARAYLRMADEMHVLNTGTPSVSSRALELLAANDHLRIDNTTLDPEAVARQVVKQLGLAAT